jgi:uncharacterized membrane protein YidH (DUF202 family)
MYVYPTTFETPMSKLLNIVYIMLLVLVAFLMISLAVYQRLVADEVTKFKPKTYKISMAVMGGVAIVLLCLFLVGLIFPAKSAS